MPGRDEEMWKSKVNIFFLIKPSPKALVGGCSEATKKRSRGKRNFSWDGTWMDRLCHLPPSTSLRFLFLRLFFPLGWRLVGLMRGELTLSLRNLFPLANCRLFSRRNVNHNATNILSVPSFRVHSVHKSVPRLISKSESAAVWMKT